MVSNYSNPEYLSKNQYEDPTNLNLRRALFDFSVPKVSITDKGLNYLKLKGKENILELGCGEGKVLLALRRNNHKGRLVGIDVSKGMFANAKKFVREHGIKPKIEFMEGMADSLEFPDSSFDILLSFYMLYHMPGIQKTLVEWKRVLKPNGRILVATNSSENREKFHRFKKLIGKLTRSQSPPNFSSRFSLENGQKKLEKSFKIIDSFTYEGRVILHEPQPYLNAMESYRQVFNPVPSTKAWEKAITAIKGMIEKEIKIKGYFVDKAKTGFFICSK